MGGWTIEQIDDVAVVTMTSNKVNALDDDFFSDLQAAIADIQSAAPLPVVLTGMGSCFSAGLNLLELYEFDRTTLATFVDRLSETVLAWFSLPRPTIAAVNGHAIAGGCVIALACDLRIVVDNDDAQIGLNEVQVGIPFPGVPFEIARHALSPERLREVMLTGALYTPDEARARGLVDEIVESDALLPRAIAVARAIAPDSLEAYATIKAHLLAPTLARIAESRARIDRDFLDVWFSEPARRQMNEVRERLLARH
ncbi:MAG: enoyl-CoA hydratase/isomerase family protein [Deltaproteobacteria bacterium]|nr:enoyl-CoA hydratase/isomerase family protein [Deltaproteobacteria bacterium]